MKKILTLCIVLSFAGAANADHSFAEFDDAGNIVLSGPFNTVIPKPPKARTAGPDHSHPTFQAEELEVTLIGYFADDQLVTVQIEQTNAAAGTISDDNLPKVELAGDMFAVRDACLDITQEELDADDNPMLELVETQNVQLVPAVQAKQLFVANEDGTAEGIILYMRNVPDGCDSITDEFLAEFNGAFEGFIESIREAND